MIIMAMATQHCESGRLSVNSRTQKYNQRANFHRSTTQKRPSFGEETSIQRLNKHSGGYLPQASGSRTSPGLVAGHYAGCKFSEPPLPSSLPLPPKHWMQIPRAPRPTFHAALSSPSSDRRDVTQQLKMLLKVQA